MESSATSAYHVVARASVHAVRCGGNVASAMVMLYALVKVATSARLTALSIAKMTTNRSPCVPTSSARQDVCYVVAPSYVSAVGKEPAAPNMGSNVNAVGWRTLALSTAPCSVHAASGWRSARSMVALVSVLVASGGLYARNMVGGHCALVATAVIVVSFIVDMAFALNMESGRAGHAVTTQNNQGSEGRLWAGPRRPNNWRLCLEMALRLSQMFGNGVTFVAAVRKWLDN